MVECAVMSTPTGNVCAGCQGAQNTLGRNHVYNIHLERCLIRTFLCRPVPQNPLLPAAFARQGPRAGGMSKAGAGPPLVGPAHLVARHQERHSAESVARLCPAGPPLSGSASSLHPLVYLMSLKLRMFTMLVPLATTITMTITIQQSTTHAKAWFEELEYVSFPVS